jgi:hypothetical protein
MLPKYMIAVQRHWNVYVMRVCVCCVRACVCVCDSICKYDCKSERECEKCVSERERE